jgi:hypothetical protein
MTSRPSWSSLIMPSIPASDHPCDEQPPMRMPRGFCRGRLRGGLLSGGTRGWASWLTPNCSHRPKVGCKGARCRRCWRTSCWTGQVGPSPHPDVYLGEPEDSPTAACADSFAARQTAKRGHRRTTRPRGRPRWSSRLTVWFLVVCQRPAVRHQRATRCCQIASHPLRHVTPTSPRRQHA